MQLCHTCIEKSCYIECAARHDDMMTLSLIRFDHSLSMDMWNKQPINIRHSDTKQQLKLLLGAAIKNPFKKID